MTNAETNEILKRVHLKLNDFSNAGSDVIQKIFTNLTVGEISKLCRTNHSFNTICKKEILWKNKIWNDYGMDEKNRKTWKETAKDE